MYQPTPRDLETLQAYLNAGSCAGAAKSMKITEQAVKNRLYQLRRLMGASSNPQLVFLLHDRLGGKRRRKAA